MRKKKEEEKQAKNEASGKFEGAETQFGEHNFVKDGIKRGK